MLRTCEYCVSRCEKVFGHYDRTDQKYFGHCAKKLVNDRQMTKKKNLVMEPCLIKLLSKSSCHETWCARKPGFMLLSSLFETELELLDFKSQTKLFTESISSKHSCLHHHAYYLKKFSSHVSSKCCNLFGNHNQKSRKGCREITLEPAKALAPIFPDVIPGKKMCISC